MSRNFATQRRLQCLAASVCIFTSFACGAANVFDPATSQLTIDTLLVGGKTYSNIAVTVQAYTVVSVAAGAAVTNSFDVSTNVLKLGSLTVQGNVYRNVAVRLDAYTVKSATNVDGTTSAQFNTTQTLSDVAQSTTMAFSGLALMTGNLNAQSFFPPGKVADYTGFQYLRDNDPDNMGHTSQTPSPAPFTLTLKSKYIQPRGQALVGAAGRTCNKFCISRLTVPTPVSTDDCNAPPATHRA